MKFSRCQNLLERERGGGWGERGRRGRGVGGERERGGRGWGERGRRRRGMGGEREKEEGGGGREGEGGGGWGERGRRKAETAQKNATFKTEPERQIQVLSLIE